MFISSDKTEGLGYYLCVMLNVATKSLINKQQTQHLHIHIKYLYCQSHQHSFIITTKMMHQPHIAMSTQFAPKIID